SLAVAIECGSRGAQLRLIERHNFEVVFTSEEAPHAIYDGLAVTRAQHHSGLKHIHSRDEQTVSLMNNCGGGCSIGLILKDGDQGRAVHHDHRGSRSSMISRGERRSRSGIAAISAPRASIFSTVIRRRRAGCVSATTPAARAFSSRACLTVSS